MILINRSLVPLSNNHQPILKMRWTPLDVSTTSLVNSPIFKAKDACSNAGCIFRRPKNPRSPPRLAEEQSLSVRAISSKVALNSSGLASSSLMISKRPSSSSVASSLVEVILGCLQELGLLEPLCFLRMCKTRTSLGPLEVADCGLCRLVDRSSETSGSFDMSGGGGLLLPFLFGCDFGLSCGCVIGCFCEESWFSSFVSPFSSSSRTGGCQLEIPMSIL
mmetsp:Transcript_12582/g.30043  ORF Transcript_12582/g.30043 Transcript_12582/m.30043 type:complete len:220 (-) Transcript_12582:325-984(-)